AAGRRPRPTTSRRRRRRARAPRCRRSAPWPRSARRAWGRPLVEPGRDVRCGVAGGGVADVGPRTTADRITLHLPPWCCRPVRRNGQTTRLVGARRLGVRESFVATGTGRWSCWLVLRASAAGPSRVPGGEGSRMGPRPATASPGGRPALPVWVAARAVPHFLLFIAW